MHINDFPAEILDKILEWTAILTENDSDAIKFTYGYTQAPQPKVKAQIQKYVRGELPEVRNDTHAVAVMNE